MTDAASPVRALVLGAGKSGAAASGLLQRKGAETRVLDRGDAFPEGAWDLCVASPGIPPGHEWVRECRSRGIRIVGELQLGFDEWRGRSLAVTGSKGKSSVVKLVADTLNLAGVPAIPCGNYGTPLCAVVDSFAGREGDAEGTWAVIEVSSFQMETADALHPDAAALLNLQDDHLDRHGTREAYHALKRKLLTGAKRAFDFSADGAPGTLEGDAALMAGSYFDNAVLRRNGLCAIALMRAAGLDSSAIAAGFAAFEPLPHRMQTVGVFGGVEWIDDSKATSLAAMEAGLSMAAERVRGGGAVRLVAGGLPKGDDPEKSITHLQRMAEKVYLIGRSAEEFYSAWHASVPCEICGTLDAAAESARRDARPGDCVLLSPGAASFDQFGGFEERGNRFAVLAREEKRT